MSQGIDHFQAQQQRDNQVCLLLAGEEGQLNVEKDAHCQDEDAGIEQVSEDSQRVAPLTRGSNPPDAGRHGDRG